MGTGRRIGSNATTYPVERYRPGVDDGTLRDPVPRLDEAALEMSAAGRSVRHVGSLLIACG